MRLIDADALTDAMYTETILKDTDMQRWDSGCWIRYKLFENVLKEQPTIDAVPVIRCKDCKFLRFTGTVWKCKNRLVMMLCESNDYCSRAERKEE